MRKIVFSAVILSILAFLAVFTAGHTYADISGTYKVQEVVGPDRVRIAFHGLPVVVRLANIEAGPGAKAELEKLVKGEEVAIRYVEELAFDENGIPYVNMASGPAIARVIVNVKMVEAGVADYDTSKARNKAYDSKFTAALSKAQDSKLGMWAGGVEKPETPKITKSEPGKTKPGKTAPVEKPTVISGRGYVAEINGSFFHKTACPSTRFLSKRNIVRYSSADAAERAGKCPCSRCQAERARRFKQQKAAKEAASKRKLPGKLIGLKSDPTYFYSPVSPTIKKAALSDMIGFDTLDAAKASGRKPDPVSLRLTAPPGYPPEPPAPGECIGRALPFFRPCRRPAADKSGLCKECQRGE